MRGVQSGAIVRTARRLAFTGVGASLAVSLIASLAPVGRAQASHAQASHAQASHAQALRLASRLALARLIAAETARPGHGVQPVVRTGVITGFVKGVRGAPFAGACVTASGAAGNVTAASRSDGRYVLAGLRPGGYTVRIDGCPASGLPGRRVPMSVFWPDPPTSVTVLPGQVRTLPAAMAWVTGDYGRPGGRSAAPPLTTRRKTGSISGRVTGHGRPLARICAVAIPAFAYQNGPEPHATTTKTGRYRIRGLRAGKYLVLFRTGVRSCPDDANWLPQWYPYVNSPYPPDKAAIVSVRAGRNTSHIDGRLKLGGEIAGAVRTRAGKAIRGICVNLYTGYVVNGLYQVTVAAISGRAGRYALHGLFPGSYQIQFTIGCGAGGDYAPQWWRDKASPDNANSIKIAGRTIVRGIDAALLPGGAITGTVRARTTAATPLAGVCVSASNNQDNDLALVTTARNGTYRLEGLVAGRAQVTFDPTCGGAVSAGYLPAQRSVTVRVGRTRSGLNAYLRPAAGISGMVRDFAGRPVDSVCVNIDDRSNDYAFTNAEGHYSITGVVPGKYAVDFETDCGSPGSLASQWYHDQPSSDSAELVSFTTGKIDTGVDATLRPGGTLAGVVTGPTGRPASGECVAMAPEAAVVGQGGPGIDAYTSTGAKGRYAIPDLAPGLYQVSFGCQLGRFADEWFKSQPDSTTAEYLAINPGVTATVNEKVSRAGVITGRVADPSGHPIASICVNVANAANGQFIGSFDNGAMTDHGRYTVGQLTPGRYLVQFSDCTNDVYGSQWYRGKNSETFATPVTVRAGQTTAGINGVLTVGGTISGQVTGPTGKPASIVCAYADNQAGQFSDLFFTGKDGRYHITGLSSGRYSVFITACVEPGSPNLSSIILPRPVRVVAPKVVTGVNVRLAAGGSIAGTIAGSAGSSGPQDQSCVLAVPTNPDDSYPLGWTDASGRYLLDGLAAGTYRVYLGDSYCDNGVGISSLAPQWYRDAPDQPTANLVTVSAGHTTSGISATLRPYGGIEGQVRAPTHAGVAGECVTAVPFQAVADPASGAVSAPDIAITTAAGRYRLLDLTPGRYQIEFTTGCGASGFAPQWWRDAASARSARVITVGYATITGVDATLRR